MSSPLQQEIITAIGSAEHESFVASTLFSEGWSVTFRALDFTSLQDHIERNNCSGSILVISTDCDGFTVGNLASLKKTFSQVFLFTTHHTDEVFPTALPLPTTALDLISIIRGSHRAPMRQPVGVPARKARAKVIAISSLRGNSGTSTLALNSAAELAALGKSTLLMDASTFSPSIATMIGIHGLQAMDAPHRYSDSLEIAEVTRSNLQNSIEILNSALFDKDFIVIDIGQLVDFEGKLLGNRWEGEIFIWISNYAHELWFITPLDLVSRVRADELCKNLMRNSIAPQTRFLTIRANSGRENESEVKEFERIISPLNPGQIRPLPDDSRTLRVALAKRCILSEVNHRSPLRRAIAQNVSELLS